MAVHQCFFSMTGRNRIFGNINLRKAWFQLLLQALISSSRTAEEKFLTLKLFEVVNYESLTVQCWVKSIPAVALFA